jgi:hypothetical protein
MGCSVLEPIGQQRPGAARSCSRAPRTPSASPRAPATDTPSVTPCGDVPLDRFPQRGFHAAFCLSERAADGSSWPTRMTESERSNRCDVPRLGRQRYGEQPVTVAWKLTFQTVPSRFSISTQLPLNSCGLPSLPVSVNVWVPVDQPIPSEMTPAAVILLLKFANPFFNRASKRRT